MDFFRRSPLGRSLWREPQGHFWSFYCPLCQTARRIPQSPRPLPRHFAQVGLTSVVFSLATWNVFGWKGMICFIPFWTIFEVIYRLRVRIALRCGLCGFDPYLFLHDVGRARKEIEAHWRAKFAEKGIPFPEKKSPGSPVRSPNAALTGATPES